MASPLPEQGIGQQRRDPASALTYGPLFSVQTASSRYTSLAGSARSVLGVERVRLEELNPVALHSAVPLPFVAEAILVAAAASTPQPPELQLKDGAVPVPPDQLPELVFRVSELARSE